MNTYPTVRLGVDRSHNGPQPGIPETRHRQNKNRFNTIPAAGMEEIVGKKV